MSSPHDNSPFDKKIKETATKENEERKEHLKNSIMPSNTV